MCGQRTKSKEAKKSENYNEKSAMSQEEEDLDALGFLDDFASESQLSQLNDNDGSNTTNISPLDSLLNEVEAQLSDENEDDDDDVERKEKYDFDEGDSDGEEGKIQELPAHACAYCNIFDAECVVKCLDCEEKGCAKWFCNGRPSGNGYSCIVTHMVRSVLNHFTLSCFN